MFEAIILACLNQAEDVCRAQLLPGYEAEVSEDCQARLQEAPPDLTRFDGLVFKGVPTCEPIGAPLSVEEVAPGVFVHLGAVAEPDTTNKGDVSNMGFVIGASSVAVFDAGTTRWIGEGLWRAIRAETDLPVTHVILSHMHPDHIFGAGVFEEAGARMLGHAHLPRAISDRQINYLESLTRLAGEQSMIGTQAVTALNPVTDGQTIDLGQRQITLRVWPTSHTGTDITALDEETGTLFAGDLVFEAHLPTLDGNLLGWQRVLTDLADIPAERVIPGHGGPSMPWPYAAAPVLRYLKVLEDDTRAALDEGQRLSEAVPNIASSEADKWELFDVHNPRNATVAFTELEWE